MNTQLDSFESKLLTALREHVDAGASAYPTLASHPMPHHRPRRRRLVLAMGVVAAAVGGVMFLPGIGNTPAYSVQEGNAGKIEVQVNRFEDAAGLEAALAEHGVNAQITYVPDGGQCTPGRYEPIPRKGITLTMGSNLFRITLDPGTARDDEILVVDASILRLPDGIDPKTGFEQTDGSRVIVQAELAHAPVPACVPVPASHS